MSKVASDTKQPNYTPELENTIKALYDGGKGKSVADIAAEINRTPKSVLGKLVHMGVYVPAEKPVKTFADQGPSKKELLAVLESIGFSEDALKGLGNATKPALQEVVERVKAA
jgi:hypothetical protein